MKTSKDNRGFVTFPETMTVDNQGYTKSTENQNNVVGAQR